MGIEAPAEIKYSLIYSAISEDDNELKIQRLCEIAGVSRSGYYRWINAKDEREAKSEKDKADFKLILEAYHHRGYAKGARGIHMQLLHTGTLMNIKRIRRLMNLFGLICPFRKGNPYKQMARALKTNTVAPNILKRRFELLGVRKVLLTDITYLFYKSGCCYLSTILDACTHEILAYQLSESLKIDFVIETINKLIVSYGAELDDEVIVHSDQGCHYTSHAFIQKLKDENFIQSMSRKGNCWDNSPQESFFGHMKDEIKYEISLCRQYDDVRYLLNDWINYYNEERYQWDLLKLSPKQYYEYLKTGYYPLTGINKSTKVIMGLSH